MHYMFVYGFPMRCYGIIKYRASKIDGLLISMISFEYLIQTRQNETCYIDTGCYIWIYLTLDHFEVVI